VFGLTFEKLLVVAVLVALVVGPRRLPGYAERLGAFARGVRAFTDTARGRAAAEMGLDDTDWRALDPRRYDPRRIVADALREPPVPPASAQPVAAPPGGPAETAASAPDDVPATVRSDEPASHDIPMSAPSPGSSGHPRRRVAAESSGSTPERDAAVGVVDHAAAGSLGA
jgi:sec-independent protein translocase protein TatB